MDTQSLRLFVEAAELLNISAAGRRLGMAPAVSSAKLAKLEKALGAELLHRSTRKVSLSLEGSEFLPFAREILAQEAAARSALGQGSGDIRGTLRFAASSTFAQLYIAPILPDFLNQFPEITLDLRLSDQPSDLIDGSYDLALRSAALEDSSLKARKLAGDVRVLCAAPTYLGTYGTPKTTGDLEDHQVIAFRHTDPRILYRQDGHEEVFDPSQSKCRLIIDDGQSQKNATIAGAGISVNSLWSIQKELDEGALVRVLADYTVEEATGLWLIYPKSNVLSPKVRVLIDFLITRIGPVLP